jgi:hypothetical protein
MHVLTNDKTFLAVSSRLQIPRYNQRKERYYSISSSLWIWARKRGGGDRGVISSIISLISSSWATHGSRNDVEVMGTRSRRWGARGSTDEHRHDGGEGGGERPTGRGEGARPVKVTRAREEAYPHARIGCLLDTSSPNCVSSTWPLSHSTHAGWEADWTFLWHSGRCPLFFKKWKSSCIQC